jgi:hypothetical protein
VNSERANLATRVGLGGLGVAGIAYGAIRLLQNAHNSTHPYKLAEWLIGSLLVHDLIIAPVVLGLGWLAKLLLPSRARTFVLGALVAGGLATAIGVVLNHRKGKTTSPTLALLTQDYKTNLLILYAVIAGVALVGYAASVRRDRQRNERSPIDH